MISRSRFVAFFFAVLPSVALAHGEEALLMPIGTLVALVAILIGMAFWRVRWWQGVIACGVALVAPWPIVWFMSANISEAAIFLLGFVPSTLGGAIAVWQFHSRRQAHDGA